MLDRGLALEIFKLDANALLAGELFFRIAADVALALEHIEHPHAQLRRRSQDRVLPGLLAVADAGEHITQRIGHCHSCKPLPARLGDTGDQALIGQLPEHDPRQAELAIISARPAGQLATVANPRRVPVARHFGQLQTRDQALGLVLALVVRDRLQLRVLRSMLLDELLAPLVLVDRTQFRHDLSSSPNGEAAYAASRCSSCGKGKLNRRSSSRASSSDFAVVVMMTSMPRTLSI